MTQLSSLAFQFKLFYDPLTPLQHTKAWESLLPPPPNYHTTKPGTRASTWNKSFLLQLGERYDVNGREVKNMIKAVIALAETEGVALSEKHLQTVNEVSSKWKIKVDSMVEKNGVF